MVDGMLISLEGIDGSGHSTQARRLRERLEKDYSLSNEEQPTTVLSKEPTDGPIGGEIREFLSGRLDIGPETLALMFAADRKDHAENELQTYIENGKIVILDRYILSTLAYQGVQVKDDEWLWQINSKALMPDLTILLDVSPVEAKRRMTKDRPDEDIFETVDKLENVREKYLEVAKNCEDRGIDVRIIDGELSKDSITDKILKHAYDKIHDKNIPINPENSSYKKLHEFK
jgi:dTMP kinase